MNMSDFCSQKKKFGIFLGIKSLTLGWFSNIRLVLSSTEACSTAVDSGVFWLNTLEKVTKMLPNSENLRYLNPNMRCTLLISTPKMQVFMFPPPKNIIMLHVTRILQSEHRFELGLEHAVSSVSKWLCSVAHGRVQLHTKNMLNMRGLLYQN